MAKHTAIPDRDHRVIVWPWLAPAWLLMAALVGAAIASVAVLLAQREVPDVYPGPLSEPPALMQTSATSATPTPSVAQVPERTTVRVVEPSSSSTSSVRPPLQFESLTPLPEIDYRSGRIMEPWPRDDLESQRRRAYARCVAGREDDAVQVAYCDRWYGPGSGYTPDR